MFTVNNTMSDVFTAPVFAEYSRYLIYIRPANFSVEKPAVVLCAGGAYCSVCTMVSETEAELMWRAGRRRRWNLSGILADRRCIRSILV